jgi:hypothetical protein
MWYGRSADVRVSDGLRLSQPNIGTRYQRRWIAHCYQTRSLFRGRGVGSETGIYGVCGPAKEEVLLYWAEIKGALTLAGGRERKT